MTGDLISREAALDVLRNAMSSFRIVGMRSGKTLLQSAVNEAFEGLNNLHAVDAAPVVHGRWEFRQNKECSWCTDAICAACKNVIDSYVDNNLEYRQKKIKTRLRYCPNCGAKMDKEANY